MKLYSTPGLSAHVPKAFALTVDFFQPWCENIMGSPEWKELLLGLDKSNKLEEKKENETDEISQDDLIKLCNKIKGKCTTLPVSLEQAEIIKQLQEELESWGGLAAVRSSAPEEDGSDASFAGAFETKLGVTASSLEEAIKECFASVFDYRVFCYVSSSYQRSLTLEPKKTSDSTADSIPERKIAFAVVVMEMVDSYIAGVAFSANPINSDLDEMVVDSSWGLGESVVDGTIEADHFIYNKITNDIVSKKIGSKKQQKVLVSDGGVKVEPIDEVKQTQSSLSSEQLRELAELLCLVESTYGKPMDVEWAYVQDRTNEGQNGTSATKNEDNPTLKLLQARPITTIHRIDEHLITKPGEPRILYYDFNIASEATTRSPFTHMDMTLYNYMCSILMGTPNLNWFPSNSRLPMFTSCTRQYANLSLWFKFPFITPTFLSDFSRMLDPYLSDIFASKDCDMEKYHLESFPPELNLSNAWFFLRQFPLWTMYNLSSAYNSSPAESKERYLKILNEDMSKLEELERRGMKKQVGGLHQFFQELMEAIQPSLSDEVYGAMNAILPLFRELDSKRRDSSISEEERSDYDALCGGYEGDPLMEMNIAMYQLARKLPNSIWNEYTYETFHNLADRIESNLAGKRSDIPQEFLTEWKEFMKQFGFDGEDQMFISSARYTDRPEILLAKLRHNIGDSIIDPAAAQLDQLRKRRDVMTKLEDRAKNQWYDPFALSKIKKRNAILDHLMWIRNQPKLRLSRLIAIFRRTVLQIQDEFIEKNRLEEIGDIFHLSIQEVESAIEDESLDLKELLIPRKVIYERAKKAKLCPMIFDSRCRILKPDAHVQDGEDDPNTLVGAALSPGVVTGRVRVVDNPTERFETGEVLAAFVTDPAWTPLFARASAVILQVGGVLQHGALCAREYGLPAVSGIDVETRLETGMLVEIDGNTGVVKIVQEGDSMLEE